MSSEPESPLAEVKRKLKANEEEIKDVQKEIKEVEKEIDKVEQKIDKVEQKIDKVDDEQKKQLREKEKQLREEEKLLREEEKLLREKENLLLSMANKLIDTKRELSAEKTGQSSLSTFCFGLNLCSTAGLTPSVAPDSDIVCLRVFYQCHLVHLFGEGLGVHVQCACTTVPSPIPPFLLSIFVFPSEPS